MTTQTSPKNQIFLPSIYPSKSTINLISELWNMHEKYFTSSFFSTLSFRSTFFVVTFMSERSVLLKRRRIFFCLANAFNVHLQMIASSCWLNQHEVQTHYELFQPFKKVNLWTFLKIEFCGAVQFCTCRGGNVPFFFPWLRLSFWRMTSLRFPPL